MSIPTRQHATSPRGFASLAALIPQASRRQATPQVLALACCLLAASATGALAEPSVPAVTSAPTSTASTGRLSVAPGVVSWPQDARISLDLRRVPLTSLLSLLSAQSGVRFRLATIPDVEVSVSLQNAPLQQAVRDLLAFHGFDLRPGPDSFWLVDAPAISAASAALEAPDSAPRPRDSAASPGAAQVAAPESGSRGSQAWRWWTSVQAPPPRWMIQNSDEIAYEGAPTESGVPGVAPFGVRVRLQPPPLALSRWKVGAQKFQAASPGVMPAPFSASRSAVSTLPGASLSIGPASGASAGGSSSGASGVRWCARWPVFLRLVPTRCLLVIESERPANLYINGARLLRSWTGRRTLEVSGSLQKGSNLLALEWTARTSTSLSAASVQAPEAVPEAAPVVRYEWLVAQ